MCSKRLKAALPLWLPYYDEELTDIAACWTENRATWNKGAEGVVKQVENIEKKLPFLILGFDCDNGSEFLNWHLLLILQRVEQRYPL
jgi:hypothetical protein